jgi:hypothetical protein
MKRRKKRKIPVPLNLEEARKSLREARKKLGKSKPQLSEVHAAIWGAAAPAAWGTAGPQPTRGIWPEFAPEQRDAGQ